MLHRADLERIAPTLTRGNVGHVEKLYLQDIVLSTVSRETADHLVFKGGTALAKFYQLDRFSEDLNFTARRSIDGQTLLDTVRRDLETYGASVDEHETDDSSTSFHARLGIAGPLYTGDRRSLSFLRIEVHKRSSVSRTRNRRYTPQFSDIPSFELAVMTEEEILAEKVRAIATRSQPRDLYDVYHLVQNAVSVDRALVQEKLDYYDLTYSKELILQAAQELESNWNQLTPLTYDEPPSFADAMDAIERALNNV